ncbi:MAG: hypothetical protein ACJ8C4_07210 [Gemmataceae bacterium]
MTLSRRGILSAAALAVLAAAGGVWSSLRDRPPEPAVAVADVEMGDIAVQPDSDPHPMTVVITNRGDRPVRLIGLPTACTPQFCFHLDFDGEKTIDPGQSLRVTGELACTAGPFDFQAQAVFDDGHARTATYRIRGNGVSPP